MKATMLVVLCSLVMQPQPAEAVQCSVAGGSFTLVFKGPADIASNSVYQAYPEPGSTDFKVSLEAKLPMTLDQFEARYLLNDAELVIRPRVAASRTAVSDMIRVDTLPPDIRCLVFSKWPTHPDRSYEVSMIRDVEGGDPTLCIFSDGNVRANLLIRVPYHGMSSVGDQLEKLQISLYAHDRKENLDSVVVKASGKACNEE